MVLVESDETRAMAPSTKAGAGLGVGLGAVRAPSAEEAEASRAAEDAEVRRRHRLPGVLADEQTGPAKERRAQCWRQRPRQEFWQHSDRFGSCIKKTVAGNYKKPEAGKEREGNCGAGCAQAGAERGDRWGRHLAAVYQRQAQVIRVNA